MAATQPPSRPPSGTGAVHVSGSSGIREQQRVRPFAVQRLQDGAERCHLRIVPDQVPLLEPPEPARDGVRPTGGLKCGPDHCRTARPPDHRHRRAGHGRAQRRDHRLPRTRSMPCRAVDSPPRARSARVRLAASAPGDDGSGTSDAVRSSGTISMLDFSNDSSTSCEPVDAVTASHSGPHKPIEDRGSGQQTGSGRRQTRQDLGSEIVRDDTVVTAQAAPAPRSAIRRP